MAGSNSLSFQAKAKEALMNKYIGTSGSLLIAALVGLQGCGGGGGSPANEIVATPPTAVQPPTPQTPAPPPVTPVVPVVPVATDFTLSGTVATGAAFDGATLKITDQSGVVVCTSTVSSTGGYSCTMPTTTKVPLIITATRDDDVLVSTVAQTQSGTINVTPLTHLLAAQLSTSGDPTKLADEVKANAALFDQAKLTQKLDSLVALIKPLSDAIGTNKNPLTDPFTTNGTGHDRVLDALQVSVRPDGTGSNIELTVKATQAAADAAPASVSFRSNASSAGALPTIASASLPSEGTAPLVADLVSRLQACYALPAIDRVTQVVNSALPSSSTVKSDVCKSVFINNDPSAFRHNGIVVGSGRNVNAYSGMFRDSATGVKFDRPNLEYLLPNGDLAVTYRWTDSVGNTDNDQVVARKVGNKLVLVGNQYLYEANVRALVQNREYLNTPAFNHVATGYNIAIKNRSDVNGLPVFSSVEVVSPRGSKLSYVPVSGRSNLSIFVPAVGTTAAKTFNTSVVRLAAKYENPLTQGKVSEKETNLFFPTTELSDDEIRSLPDHGVWTLRFVHADTTIPDVTQYYKTTSRAPTIAEAQYMQFATLTNQMRSDLVSKSSASGAVTWLTAPSAATPNRAFIAASNNTDAWMVPTGALAPTSVTIYGRLKDNLSATGAFVSRGAPFDDTAAVVTNTRKVTINCSKTGASDLHCDATDPSQFVQGSYFNSLELWARSAKQVEVSKMLAMYKIQ
jgi:hypothetical protein